MSVDPVALAVVSIPGVGVLITQVVTFFHNRGQTKLTSEVEFRRDLAKELESLRRDHHDLQAKNLDTQSKLLQLVGEKQELDWKVKHYEDNERKMGEQIQELQRQVSSLLASQTNDQNTIDRLRAELDVARAELDVARSGLEGARLHMQSCRTEQK